MFDAVSNGRKGDDMADNGGPVKLITVEGEWLDFAGHVFAGTGISRDGVQYRETRRAFYAGFFALMAFLKRVENNVPDQVYVSTLTMLDAELTRFCQDVKKGRA